MSLAELLLVLILGIGIYRAATPLRRRFEVSLARFVARMQGRKNYKPTIEVDPKKDK